METSFFAPYQNVPISALNASCRWKLSEGLSVEMPLASAAGYPRTWEGLAELIGLRFDRIKLFRNKQDPTACLIEYWEDKPDATVGKLIEFLKIMERYDVLQDIMTFVERDSRRYLKEQEEERSRLEARHPVQDPQVSSGDPVKCNLTVQDIIVPRVKEEKLTKYDAYVSYAETDVEFVLDIVKVLEGEKKLKLFIKDRDMLPGLIESEAQIKMMHERCERILLILSPEFLNDPKCEFQTVLAQALQVENNMYARKVIPIVYKQCELPVRLRFIASLNYSKRDMFGSFWTRLYTSITKPNQMDGTNGPLAFANRNSSSSSMSSLMDMSSLSSMDIDSPSTSKPPLQLLSVPVAASNRDSLSAAATQDSGICISARSGSVSDIGSVVTSMSTFYDMEMTASASNLSVSDSKHTHNKQKKSPVPPRKKSFFSWGSSGHSSN